MVPITDNTVINRIIPVTGGEIIGVGAKKALSSWKGELRRNKGDHTDACGKPAGRDGKGGAGYFLGWRSAPPLDNCSCRRGFSLLALLFAGPGLKMALAGVFSFFSSPSLRFIPGPGYRWRSSPGGPFFISRSCLASIAPGGGGGFGLISLPSCCRRQSFFCSGLPLPGSSRRPSLISGEAWEKSSCYIY